MGTEGQYYKGLNHLQKWLDFSPDTPAHICSTCKISHEVDERVVTQKRHNYKQKPSKKNSALRGSKNSKYSKMAPISEKRSPPLINDNAKENISGTKTLYDKLNTKGPEILDFRESWLQEIEMYKEHGKNQAMLSQHNHLHTPEGCFRDAPKENKSSEPAKRRLRTRSDSDSHDPNRGGFQKEPDDELVLKRAREESYAPHTNNSHHISHSNQRVFKRKSPSPQPTPKIIVNPFHVSLLGATQQDKPKLLNSISTASSVQSSGPVCLNGISKKHKQRPKSPMKLKDVGKDSIASVPRVQSPQTISSMADTTPPPPTRTIAEEPNLKIFPKENEDKKENDEKSDDGSKIDDEDEDFGGDIDDVDHYDSTSDSEDEYKGYAYMFDSDEEHEPIESDQTSIASSATTSTQYITPKSPFTPSLFPLVPPYLTFSSHVEKGPPIPLELHKILKWKHSNVMPKIVKRVIINSGFRLIKKTNDWIGTWEKHMKSPCFKTVKSHQKYNHLPGTFKIGRKDSAWKNLRQYMGKHGKKEFGFMQKTFILPMEVDMLKKAWPKYAKKDAKWIIKPPASARGTGIKVVSRWSEIPKQRPLIVQRYIEKPLLIHGNKFDLRLYVVVTSINPMRIFLHTDGLARFASVQYSDKLDTLSDRCMHLTNYSINKLSANYSRNEDFNACQGHKWTLKSLWSYFRQRKINTKLLWGTLRNLVIRTILSGEYCLNRMFKLNVNSRYCCYELFGFDVLLDENLVPWLLEVNISPSLHSDLPLDLHVKGPLIQAVLNAAMYQVPPKLSDEDEMRILREYNLKGPLTYDRRLYTMCLSPEETKKHNQFTNKTIESRDDYLTSILEDLTPDDIRCLIIAEDELARSSPMERIFPGPESHVFLKFIEGPRYYNRLLDAWETQYGKNRQKGIELLQKLCASGRHLLVPPSALKKELSIEDALEGSTANSHIDVSHHTQPSRQDGEPNKTNEDDLALVTQTSCSKQAAVPEKQNVEAYRGPRPISVEIK